MRRGSPGTHNRPGGIICLAVLACLAASIQGCSGKGGTLEIESVGLRPVSLEAEFEHGWYMENQADASFFFSTAPLDMLLGDEGFDGQFVHVQLLWKPRPGRTPIDRWASNISIRYVVLSGDQIGIYGGSGFAWIGGKPGDKSMRLSIKDSRLSLLESTDGFQDLLSPASISGTVRARLDTIKSLRIRRAMSQIVTDALGQTRWVDRGRSTAAQQPG